MVPFGTDPLPRWYNSLYRIDPSMVVECHNRGRGGMRFFFQGTGYSESSNSDYRRLINQENISMPLILAEIRRVIVTRMEEHACLCGPLTVTRHLKMISSGLFSDFVEADKFLMSTTDYACRKFYNLIYTPSLQCTIQNHTVSSVQTSPQRSSPFRTIVFLLYRDERTAERS